MTTLAVEEFAQAFKRTDGPAEPRAGQLHSSCEPEPAQFNEFLAAFSGATFNNGLYRFHDASSAARTAGMLAEAFPAVARTRVNPFGYDWLGRQFTIDPQRRDDGEPLVLMLEPGTGMALEIPLTFGRFHQQLPTTVLEPALAASFFQRWREQTGTVEVARTQCVGYRVPLFLGGRDDVDNLELTDLDVYLSLCGQLYAGTRPLEPGTRVDSVEGS